MSRYSTSLNNTVVCAPGTKLESWSMIPPPRTTGWHHQLITTRRNFVVQVLMILATGHISSQIWVCSSFPSWTGKPQISFPKICPTRSVPISLAKVESVPVRIAPLVTQRIHMSPNPIQSLQSSSTSSLRKLDGSMNGTGAMPILIMLPKLSWEAKMALLPVRWLDMCWHY